MKFVKKIIFTLIIFSIFFSGKVLATEEIIKEQIETLNIYELINEGEKYTKKIFPDLNLNNLLENAILGEIDNKSMYTYIVDLFGQEIRNTFKILRRDTSNYCNT